MRVGVLCGGGGGCGCVGVNVDVGVGMVGAQLVGWMGGCDCLMKMECMYAGVGVLLCPKEMMQECEQDEVCWNSN